MELVLSRKEGCVMFRTAEIALAVTKAWVRDGAPNKTPKEVADFYRGLYKALEEAQGNTITKVRARDIAVQLTCAGLLLLLVTMWVLLAIFAK
jgi:hypothetical protein